MSVNKGEFMGRVEKEKRIRKFTGKMQAKLLLVFCVMIIAMIILIGRLVFLNRTDGERYAKRVLSQQTYSTTVIPYQRGSIIDRKGTILASSEKVYNLILDVNKMLLEDKYQAPTISALTESYKGIYKDLTEASIHEIVELKPTSRYVILQKGLSYDEMMIFKKKAAEDKNIQGVWFEESYVRTYPYNTLASDILGFTSDGNVGNYGIEQYYNDELNGINGREYGYMDSELKLERTVKPAKNGNTIVSTIDANVQGIVQNNIKKFLEETGSMNVGVIMMNPNNGEIIAMASNEAYDLNNPFDLTPFYTKEEIKVMNEEEKQTALYSVWRNFTISDTFEPGSTFKPFTIAMGLEEDIIKKTESFFCDGGEDIAGWRIRCSHVHDTIDLYQALAYSCNDAMMEIGKRTGRTIFNQYQNFFGFGAKTGVDLPGEAVGLLVNEKGLNATELATSSFGQTLSTTMIQVISGYSSLINGGYYYKPHIVKQIVNDQGAVVQNIDKILVKETVSSETAEFIREASLMAVEEGTAKKAKPAGYSLGGKTGTAEKGKRDLNNYVVSFIGHVPADKPEIVIFVVIDQPDVAKQDNNSYATILTSKILSEVLRFLELYPTEEVKDSMPTGTPVLPSTNSNESSEEGDPEKETSEEDQNTVEEENQVEDKNAENENVENENTENENTVEENTEE